MHDNGKETSVGFGFHPIAADKARSERLSRPSHWSSGLKVISAEEYDRFTDQLARELMATCTPEHIAVIAAQHMIYVDELKCALEGKKSELSETVEAVRSVATKVAIQTTMITLRAWRQHIAQKRADGVRARKKDVMALAQHIAAEQWREDTDQKIKVGEMAGMVYSTLQATEYRKLVSAPGSVRRWIKPVTPAYASQPGSQRQSFNRNE